MNGKQIYLSSSTDYQITTEHELSIYPVPPPTWQNPPRRHHKKEKHRTQNQVGIAWPIVTTNESEIAKEQTLQSTLEIIRPRLLQKPKPQAVKWIKLLNIQEVMNAVSHILLNLLIIASRNLPRHSEISVLFLSGVSTEDERSKDEAVTSVPFDSPAVERRGEYDKTVSLPISVKTHSLMRGGVFQFVRLR